MSHVAGADECGCSCHHPRQTPEARIRHCVPCCDGQCQRCKQYVSRGRMKEHLAKHEARIAELMKEYDQPK